MKTICVDFDGVIHSYASGWSGAGVAGDPPVPGAVEFLVELVMEGYTPAIYSARSAKPEGIEVMRDYVHQMLHKHYEGDDRAIRIMLDAIQFPVTKPPALVYIDDRGFRFEGVWPSMKELHELTTPWTKRVRQLS